MRIAQIPKTAKMHYFPDLSSSWSKIDKNGPFSGTPLFLDKFIKFGAHLLIDLSYIHHDLSMT